MISSNYMFQYGVQLIARNFGPTISVDVLWVRSNLNSLFNFTACIPMRVPVYTFVVFPVATMASFVGMFGK